MLASANLAALLLAEALLLLRQAVVLLAMVALKLPLQQHCLRIASLESACWPRPKTKVADGAALVHRLVQEQRACASAALTCHAQGQASSGRERTARAGKLHARRGRRQNIEQTLRSPRARAPQAMRCIVSSSPKPA